MNRLYPAETRLKEGAYAHDSDQNRWECSLAAGWWRPVARSRQYQGTAVSMSNTASSADAMSGVADLRMRILPDAAEHAFRLFDLPTHHAASRSAVTFSCIVLG